MPEPRIAPRVEDAPEAQRVEEAVEVGPVDGPRQNAAQHLGGGASAILAPPMRPMRLPVEIIHPSLVDAQQQLPARRRSRARA